MGSFFVFVVCMSVRLVVDDSCVRCMCVFVMCISLKMVCSVIVLVVIGMLDSLSCDVSVLFVVMLLWLMNVLSGCSYVV